MITRFDILCEMNHDDLKRLLMYLKQYENLEVYNEELPSIVNPQIVSSVNVYMLSYDRTIV